jgi:hypothetical protein
MNWFSFGPKSESADVVQTAKDWRGAWGLEHEDLEHLSLNLLVLTVGTEGNAFRLVLTVHGQ